VGVDIISCGTGKRDRRIANPGPYRAYLRHGFLEISVQEMMIQHRPAKDVMREDRQQDLKNLFPCQGFMMNIVIVQKEILISIYMHIRRYMPQVTTVRMRTDTKALLDDLKLSPRETYDDVVRRLAEAAYDDEPLNPEEIKAMEEGIADIKAGRVRSLSDVMKDLGDDNVINSRTS
jgi:predicted transcriptional regulator